MIKKIKFTDVNPLKSRDSSIIKKEIFNTIKAKNFILGRDVKKFENNFSKLSQIKYSASCASGTDALILALKSLDIKSTEEVIVPAMTYISTGLSVLLNNNKLVYADIDSHTGLISFDSIIKNINKKTKVVIPVNMYGQKVDLKKLRKKIGKKIFIIEFNIKAWQDPTVPTPGKSATNNSLQQKAANCSPSTGRKILEFNNVSALIETGGSMWQDRSRNDAAYEVPIGSGEKVIYAGALWMGGMDVNNQLLTVALKKGQAANYPLMGKEIDKAGYLAMEWFLLNQGKLMSRPFKAKKPNKK